jgi:hypothetical protein
VRINTTASLDARRVLLCAYVNEIRSTKLREPLEFDGYTYDTDETSISNLNSVISAISAGIAPATITWRTADNISVQHTQESLKALAESMLFRQQVVYGTSFALKDAINSIQQPEAIDIHSGW